MYLRSKDRNLLPNFKQSSLFQWLEQDLNPIVSTPRVGGMVGGGGGGWLEVGDIPNKLGFWGNR